VGIKQRSKGVEGKLEMSDIKKKAIVVHSGGMDSSLCLALAMDQFGAENVLSMSFSYGQRHTKELEMAKIICKEWNVDNTVINLDCLNEITDSALFDSTEEIKHKKGEVPNTIVVGRNGLMARIAGIHADHIGAEHIFMGIIEVEAANSGYRDCTRKYMDIIQAGLRVDLDNQKFEIKTPLVYMDKKQTMELGYQMGVLHFLVENTLSCYKAVEKQGCLKCPACKLRNEGLNKFSKAHPDFEFSYRTKI
jgi:7-cyano-7-deazaguanine synthase